MILVTGATGRTGQHVVDALLAQGHAVRILVRATSVVPERWRQVERATGDLADADSLRRALVGADGLFVLAPMDPALDVMEATAFAAAEAVGVGLVVKMSTTRPDPESPIPWWRAHFRAEQRLRCSGLAWVVLRPNGISFFLLDHAREVREEGVLRTAGGDGRMALVDAADIAAVTAAVFSDPDRWVGDTLDLTGPEALSYGDVADRLSAVTGRSVVAVDIDPAQARAEMLAAGRPAWEADGVVANWLMTRDGSGGFERVTGDVERVTGRRPLAIDHFLAEHRAEFTPV